ncbi:MAG: DUF1553 domain-containing protein [Candidatus Hydrogenedens sp.]|nr:DUF1553 domain-containing protein [Candidatus Hydrogenedens sp.]
MLIYHSAARLGGPYLRFKTGRVWGSLVLILLPLVSDPAAAVDFEHDIRPILSDTCFRCHGPDENSRKAGLRLDIPDAALHPEQGEPVIVAGHPDRSELLRRIESTDPDDLMPPPESGKELKPEQIAALRAWIAEGADWPAHWAFTPPVRPAVPEAGVWARNPIDAFVEDRLKREGLFPSPEADGFTLLRRLSLDLTGLPPTLEEMQSFAVKNPDLAYEEAVDRLLASPHFGERWARHWLDAAQFADSDGFEKDKPRQVWAWRDWVINAFNDNMPYDRFLTEQIAGDLLPFASQSQRVATGFLRNSLQNEEGGIDPEQFRMEAIFNRVDVVGRAVLGLTLQCAQCHTHKYDPISHTEYYRLLAYVNNTDEARMTVYAASEEAQRNEVLAKVAEHEQDIQERATDWEAQLTAWADEARSEPQPDWHTLELAFDDDASGGQKFLPRGDGAYLAQGYAPTRFAPKMSGKSPVETITAVRLDLLTDANLPRNGPGRSIHGGGALSEFELRIAPVDKPFETFDSWERIPVASAIADVNPPKQDLGPEFPDNGKPRGYVTGSIQMAIDGEASTAWTTDIGPGRSNRNRYAIFVLADPLKVEPGMQIGIRLAQYHGGWNSDDNQSNNLGCFKLSVTDASDLPETAYPEEVLAALETPASDWSESQQGTLFSAWRSTQFALAIDNLAIESLWREHPEGTTQLVYHERRDARETYRLERGDFLQRAEKVEPGVPAFLNPMPDDMPPNRLALARWATDRQAPTTARAFVNRVWQHLFGVGLVDTPSDLGSQGSPPSHPELLDWLAVEFMDSGWDIKALVRLMVESATYRQSSDATPELLERDPGNRLLARAGRFRVEAEIVRDITLAASGLLNPEVGGPSVYPPAPEFLFVPPASYGPKVWNTDDGADRYRRGLYTFRFRSVPYPALQAFDAPPGDAPCTRRTRSNTPLQALTTLNEPGFVETARALAEKTLAEGGTSDAARIDYAFRRCTARPPSDGELATLHDYLLRQRDRIANGGIDPTAIQSAIDLPTSEADPAELTAWTLTARVMLNLDETITRQ